MKNIQPQTIEYLKKKTQKHCVCCKQYALIEINKIIGFGGIGKLVENKNHQMNINTKKDGICDTCGGFDD